MICFHEVGLLRALLKTRFILRLGAPLLGLLTIYFVFFFESSTPEPVFAQESQLAGGDIIPIRQLSDPYPVFNGIAVDPASGLLAMTDVNRKGLLTYSRTAESRRGEITPPLRQIFGPLTKVGFVAGIAL